MTDKPDVWMIHLRKRIIILNTSCTYVQTDSNFKEHRILPNGFSFERDWTSADLPPIANPILAILANKTC